MIREPERLSALGCSSGGKLRRTLGTAAAYTTEDDVGDLNGHAEAGRSLQAGRRPVDTLHVFDPTALGADGVVVIVMGAGLVAGRRPGRIETAKQLTRGEVVEHCVYRLHGDIRQLLTHGSMHSIGGPVRVGFHNF